MQSTVEIYKETEDYVGSIEHLGDYVLIHLDIRRWSPGVYKEVHKLFHEVREKFMEEGYEEMYTTTTNPSIVKLCKKIHPVFEIKEIDYFDEGVAYVIMWETGL